MLKRLTIYLSSALLILLTFTVQARELPDFTELVEKYGPAVVNISTKAKKVKTKEKSSQEKSPGMPDDLDDLFRRFFDNPPENFKFEQRPATSLGSGFITSKDGYVVTNNHVIDNAGEIIVRLNDRRELEAEVIGADKRSDIALLKIIPKEGEELDLPVVKLGDSDSLKVGEWVLAIGSPFGFERTVTAGIVSAKGRSLPSDNYVPFIQTDVAINPGNSGGPLFDMDGKVIGINAQIYSRTGGFMGLSFAVPVNLMQDVVKQLKEKGKVSRGWLGVLIQDIDRGLAESFNMDKPEGALVAEVLDDSPAKAAGFKQGDIIINFNDVHVNRSSDLPPIVGSTDVGTAVPVDIIRGGKSMVLNVTIAELPPEDEIQLARGMGGKSDSNKLGLTVSDLEPNQRDTLDIEEGGVLVEEVKEGPARDAGIHQGDVIMMIKNITIEDVRHFKEVTSELEAGATVAVLIYRHGSPRFLSIEIPEDDN